MFSNKNWSQKLKTYAALVNSEDDGDKFGETIGRITNALTKEDLDNPDALAAIGLVLAATFSIHSRFEIGTESVFKSRAAEIIKQLAFQLDQIIDGRKRAEKLIAEIQAVADKATEDAGQ